MTHTYVPEYAEECCFLWMQRSHAVHAPNYSPQQFADLDERLAAHIDGLRVAGDEGWQSLEAQLDDVGPEVFFPAAVLALEAKDERFEDLVQRATNAPEAVPGLISALGWVSPEFLSGRVGRMLADVLPLNQKLAIAACAVHRKDPGATLEKFIASTVDSVRIRAIRTAGELGRIDLLPRVQTSLGHVKQEAAFWASWSGVLLGDRSDALETLSSIALKAGPRQLRALQVALQALQPAGGHELLMRFGDASSAIRLRIIGSGFVGDPRYVPWLIEQMQQPALARVAAEAFVNITGADFNIDQLESMPPDGFEDGPTEDPDDENVELPEDIALPWPNMQRIREWWSEHQSTFAPGSRFFLGQPVTASHCMRVLRDGFQRQRIAAAQYVSLLNPGTPLFNTAAPAGRQQGLLEKLT